MKRVCRATLQCESYSLQHAIERGDRIRATITDLFGRLRTLTNFDEIASRSLPHGRPTEMVMYIFSIPFKPNAVTLHSE